MYKKKGKKLTGRSWAGGGGGGGVTIHIHMYNIYIYRHTDFLCACIICVGLCYIYI